VLGQKRLLPDEADQFATQCIEEIALQESPFQQHNAPRDIYLFDRRSRQRAELAA
jgi:hypothetical protein